jgi:hypothetical protein
MALKEIEPEESAFLPLDRSSASSGGLDLKRLLLGARFGLVDGFDLQPLLSGTRHTCDEEAHSDKWRIDNGRQCHALDLCIRL